MIKKWVWRLLRNKLLKGLKIFTGSWVHGHGAVGVGCRLWRLISNWLRNNWKEVAEMMAAGG